MRATVYHQRGVEQTDPHSDRVRRRFRAGDVIESLVRDAVESSADVDEVISKFPVSIGKVTGEGDLLVRLTDGRWLVLEVKSAKTVPDKPDPRHAGQARTYAVGVHEQGRDVAGALLVYIGRDDLKILEHFMPFSPAWATELEKRVSELDGYLADERLLPPRMGHASNRKARACWGCPWMTLCWGPPRATGATEMRRRDQRLIHPHRLAELEQLAEDGMRVRGD